jgi:hypothetical protein
MKSRLCLAKMSITLNANAKTFVTTNTSVFVFFGYHTFNDVIGS